MTKNKISNYSLMEEISNAVIHGIGVLLSILALVLCIIKSSNSFVLTISIIYCSFSIVYYLFSTLYHSLRRCKVSKLFKKLSKSSTYLLILGTFMPYLLLVLPKNIGFMIFLIISVCALLGIISSTINFKGAKNLSLMLYMIIAWIIIFTMPDIINCINNSCMNMLLTGSILYVLGAIIYLSFNKKFIHSVFHTFILSASIVFFFSIYLFVI